MIVSRALVSVFAFSSLVFSAPAALADGDTLRIAHYDLPAQLGMPYGTFGSNGALPLHAVYDAMVYVDNQGAPRPGLALSWEARGIDTWVLKLRDGVTFHNGKSFDAAVVAANIEALTKDDVIRTQQVTRQLAGIVGARVVDRLTVEIKTAFPDPILPLRIAIMRPHEPAAWRDMGPEGYGTHPIGTGAYKIEEWTKESVTGVAFSEGWRQTKIPRLEILALPETAARVQALNSGQVDIAWSLRPDSIAPIEGAGNKIISSPSNNTLNLMLLHAKEGSPVTDVRVRRALNYAFNKESFIKNVLLGRTVAASQPSSPGMTGHFANIAPYPYDPDKAKQLLAEAGYPNGFNMAAEIVVSVGEFKDTMEAMANDFKKVGVNLELRVVTIPDFVKRVIGIVPWQGDAFSMMYEGYPSSDMARVMNTHSCLVMNPRRKAPAHTCFNEIMPAIKSMNTTFDMVERNRFARQIAAFYHDQATAVFSHVRVDIDGLSAKVQNYSLVNRVIPFHELTFAK